MNYPPLNKVIAQKTAEIPLNRLTSNNNNNSKCYKAVERKGISLTPDRQIHQSNSSREIIRYNSNQKYNPRLLENRNSSAKKTDVLNLHDNGNPKEKQSQKDFSQISISNNQDYSLISKLSNKSMAQAYLDRRHLETQQKINRLRHEKQTQESSELRFKPVISHKSKKIIKSLITKEQAIKVVSNNNTNIPVSKTINNHESNCDVPGNNYNYYKYDYYNINSLKIVESKNYNGGSSNVKNPVKPHFSQLDDYREIVKKREILAQNPHRNTIDNDSRNSNKLNTRASSAKPPIRSIVNNQYSTAQKTINNQRGIDRMIINNDVKQNIYNYNSDTKPNIYNNNNNMNYYQAQIKNDNSFFNNKDNNLIYISEKKQLNDYSNNNNSKPNSNLNVNLNEKKFSSVAMPPKPGYSSSIKRPSSGNPGLQSNNANNAYKNYSNQAQKTLNSSNEKNANNNSNNYKQFYNCAPNNNTINNNNFNKRKDSSYISEKGNYTNTNTIEANNSYWERNQGGSNNNNNNEVNRKLNNYCNENSQVQNKSNHNTSYYSNNSKNNNEANSALKKPNGTLNLINNRNTTNLTGTTLTRSPIPFHNRANGNNYNSNPNPKIINNNNKNADENQFNNNTNSKYNPYIHINKIINNPDNTKNNTDYRSNYNTQNLHNHNNNINNNINNKYNNTSDYNNYNTNKLNSNNNYNNNNNVKTNQNPTSKESAGNFSFHENQMLESQQVKNIDFNEFDQFSPPNNPNSNINYRETEEKEKTNFLKNQKNFDSKLNYDHHRKNDANVLLNFAENLKNNLNTEDNYADYGINKARNLNTVFQVKPNSFSQYENLNNKNANYHKQGSDAESNYRFKYGSNVNSKVLINNNNNTNNNFNNFHNENNYNNTNNQITNQNDDMRINTNLFRNNNDYQANAYNKSNENNNSNYLRIAESNTQAANQIYNHNNYQIPNQFEEQKINQFSGSSLRPNYLSNITKEITGVTSSNYANSTYNNDNALNANKHNNNYSVNPNLTNNNNIYNNHNNDNNNYNNNNLNIRNDYSEREEKTQTKQNYNFNSSFTPNRNLAPQAKERSDLISKVNSSNFYSNKDLKNPEQFKLDENSKSFLMERLNQIKSNEAYADDFNRDIRQQNLSYRNYQ